MEVSRLLFFEAFLFSEIKTLVFFSLCGKYYF